MRLPSRTITIPGVSGARGTGRSKSMVRRTTGMGAAVWSCSTNVATNAAGAPPSCTFGSQGPCA